MVPKGKDYPIGSSYPWSSTIRDTDSPYYGKLRIDTAYQFGHIDMNDPSSVAKYWSVSVRNMDLYNGAKCFD